MGEVIIVDKFCTFINTADNYIIVCCKPSIYCYQDELNSQGYGL